MAEFTVYTYMTFYKAPQPWEGVEQDTYHANKFVKALKGETVNGWAEIPVPYGAKKPRRRLDKHTQHKVFEWFGEIASATFNEDAPHVFVPLPSSKTTSQAAVKKCPAFRMAVALAERLNDATVVPAMWFDQPMKSARREQGTRDPREILANTVSMGFKFTKETYVVLVDDCEASGGHMRAAEAAMHRAGVPVDFGICCGRTVYFAESKPFSLGEKSYQRLR